MEQQQPYTVNEQGDLVSLQCEHTECYGFSTPPVAPQLGQAGYGSAVAHLRIHVDTYHRGISAPQPSKPLKVAAPRAKCASRGEQGGEVCGQEVGSGAALERHLVGRGHLDVRVRCPNPRCEHHGYAGIGVNSFSTHTCKGGVNPREAGGRAPQPWRAGFVDPQDPEALKLALKYPLTEPPLFELEVADRATKNSYAMKSETYESKTKKKDKRDAKKEKKMKERKEREEEETKKKEEEESKKKEKKERKRKQEEKKRKLIEEYNKKMTDLTQEDEDEEEQDEEEKDEEEIVMKIEENEDDDYDEYGEGSRSMGIERAEDDEDDDEEEEDDEDDENGEGSGSKRKRSVSSKRRSRSRSSGRRSRSRGRRSRTRSSSPPPPRPPTPAYEA